MSKYIIICVLFSFTQIFSQKNQGKAEYLISVSTNKEIQESSLSPKAKNFFDSQRDFAKQYTFTLEFNNGYSHCYSKQNESLNIDGDNEMLVLLRKSLLDVDKEYYFSKNKLYSHQSLNGKEFLVVTDSISNQWKLTNETKKIGNYMCYKAIKTIENKNSNKQFKQEVWYTLDIPLHYGPLEYVGLPGLVIKAQQGDYVYLLKSITINPKKRLKQIIIPHDYEIISKANFDELNMKLRNNYIKMRD